MRRLVLFLATLALVGCGAAKPDKNARDVEGAGESKKGEHSMTADSAFTWGYFFAADAAPVKAIAGQRKHSLTRYRVDRVVAVRGDAVSLDKGSTLVRLETAARLPEGDAAGPRLLFHGVPQHLQYTTTSQREELTKRSRAEVPASPDTVAVLIPIRKSPAWWAQAHDERQSHFRKHDGRPGHTAIGADYADQVYRKLYHARYATEAKGHDFITYFEFPRERQGDFERLLASLRDETKNPEWKFVDREYEIWMTKEE